jgi:hypothetical protein
MAEHFGAEGRLPARGVLLHIGPPTTGTTAVQSAFAASRFALDRQGIIYPGVTSQHRMPALAVTRARGLVGHGEPQWSDWETLVGDVRAARRRRVVVSSASFVEADDSTIEQIVAGLGGERVHVVVTLRPLAGILPSAWQQAVCNGLPLTYDEWLEETLNQDSTLPATAQFWRRHRHGELVERWRAVVGGRRIAVIVVDDADPLVLTRSFEALLGLPERLLVADNVRDDRGLTAAETELIRRLNLDFRAHDLPSSLYHHVVARGVVTRMQTRKPGPEEIGIVTPRWAVERANQLGAAAAVKIRELDVMVNGHLDSLSAVTVPSDTPVVTDELLPRSAAALALTGAEAGLARLTSGGRTPRRVEPIAARDLPHLAGLWLGRRLSAMLGWGIRRY